MAADADWPAFLYTIAGCVIEDPAVSQTTFWQKWA
jgi:hypothetical protein